MIKGINPTPSPVNFGSSRATTTANQQAAMLFNAAIAPIQPRQQSNPDTQKLKTSDMQALFDEYAQLQPQHQTPAVKARLYQINQELQRYREAYNPKGEIVAQTKNSTLTIREALPADLFETNQADFQKAVRQDFKVTQGKTYNVSGTDLLDAIEENTRLGHTAGADNNKNGAFDPSRDRHGLGKVIDKFTDKVLDNPIVRTVAQIAQFTPLAPVASVVNTVITARDVVKAVDEGNIKSLASTVISAGLSNKLGNSLNLAGDATKISVAQQLQKHALDGLTRATVSTVVEGGDFDDQLKSSLKATAATIVSQIGANKIGDLYSEGKLDNVTHKLAHTALGFAAGTVANGDGISGAVGGLAGSVAGEYFQSENAAVLAAAASAALLGKDPLLAANVAGTADRFNRQLHQTEMNLLQENAKVFAEQQGIDEEEALARLTQQALRNVDLQWTLKFIERPTDEQATDFLQTLASGSAKGRFTDDSDIQRTVFTPDNDYWRSGIYADAAKQNAAALNRAIPTDIRTKQIRADDLKTYLAQGSDETLQVLKAVIADPQGVIDELKEQAKQTYEEALATAPDELAKQTIQQGYQTVQRDLNGLWNDQKTATNGAYDWLGLEGIYGDSDANEIAAILAVAAAANTITDYTGVKGIGKSVAKNMADEVPVTTTRPTPRQSEADVGDDLGVNYIPQVSYKEGQEVPYGSSGSVRPDHVALNGTVSFEVKNYNIATNSSGLIANVSLQAIKRAENLPAGMGQRVIIDIRGQTVTDDQKNRIIQGIVEKTNGIIDPTSIRFKSE